LFITGDHISKVSSRVSPRPYVKDASLHIHSWRSDMSTWRSSQRDVHYCWRRGGNPRV